MIFRKLTYSKRTIYKGLWFGIFC